jgi:hypothetical protein
MTDESIIAKCAELGGKSVPDCLCEECLNEHGINFLESRDAIIPVIDKQGTIAQIQFMDFLQEQLNISYQDMLGQTECLACVLATPRQLCIALLKATGNYHD